MKNYEDSSKFFANYQICCDLKDLGFRDCCFAFWELERGVDTRTIPKLYLGQPYSYSYQSSPFRYAAPTLDEVTEWLRREHDYHIYILPRFDGFDGAQYGCNYSIFREGEKESRWKKQGRK